MDLVIEERNVPNEFRVRVDEILSNEQMGSEVERIWGKTEFGQHFVFVVSKVVWYAVRWILEDEYWKYPIVYQQNIDHADIFEKKQRPTYNAAKTYIEETLNNLSENKFGEMLRFRLRKLPDGFLQDPDTFLNPGAQIQCFSTGTVAGTANMETQEGIYLGKGKVAFVSADNGADVVEKLESHPKIDTLGNFLGDSAQELKVVDHCFRQFDPKEVVQIIKTLLEDEQKKTPKNRATVSLMALELKNLLKNIKTTDAIVLLLKLIIFAVNKFVKL